MGLLEASIQLLRDPFVQRQCWNYCGHHGQYQWLTETKPQGFRLTWATQLVCTMNVCLYHTYPQRVRAEGPLESHETLPCSHRRLTFGLNSRALGIGLVALWGGNPALTHTEGNQAPTVWSPLQHELHIMPQFWHSLVVCHTDIVWELPILSEEKGFLPPEVDRMARWSFQKTYYQECPSHTPKVLHDIATSSRANWPANNK